MYASVSVCEGEGVGSGEGDDIDADPGVGSSACASVSACKGVGSGVGQGEGDDGEGPILTPTTVPRSTATMLKRRRVGSSKVFLLDIPSVLVIEVSVSLSNGWLIVSAV